MIGRNTSTSSHASVAAAERRCSMITTATPATHTAIAAVMIGIHIAPAQEASGFNARAS